MRNIRLIVLTSFIAVLLNSGMSWAEEEEKPTASADIGVYSQYIWRGFELSHDSVVIQPSATVGYKGFSMNLWGNLDTHFDDGDPTTKDKEQFNETDWTLSYDRAVGPVQLGVGYIYYALDGVDDSQEIYLSAGLDLPLSPTLTIYREISHAPAWYVRLDVSHSFALRDEITLDLAGSAAYYSYDDEDFVEVDDNLNPTTTKYRNFHDGVISVGLTFPFAKYFVLNPILAYSFPLSNEADNFLTANSISNDSSFLYGGINLSISF